MSDRLIYGLGLLAIAVGLVGVLWLAFQAVN